MHMQMTGTKYAEDKKLIHFKNFFQEVYKFCIRCFSPLTIPIHFGVLYMLQSDGYMLSPEFVSAYKKIDHEEAELYWNILNNPKNVTIEEVMALVFSMKTRGKKVWT